jgi:acyl-CoA thioester hydrolase
MANIFRYKFTVADDAIDENGHVNNVAYVQWMQEAAVAHSDARGCDSARYAELGTTWVIRSHHITYSLPAFAGDQIKVFTWVADIKGSSSLRKTKFVRVSDGAVLATAETRWVYTDRKTGRPKLVDAIMKEAFVIVPEAEEP